MANYTELVDVKTDEYDVTVNASREAAQEAFEAVRDGDQWVIIHIGDQSMKY